MMTAAVHQRHIGQPVINCVLNGASAFQAASLAAAATHNGEVGSGDRHGSAIDAHVSDNEPVGGRIQRLAMFRQRADQAAGFPETARITKNGDTLARRKLAECMLARDRLATCVIPAGSARSFDAIQNLGNGNIRAWSSDYGCAASRCIPGVGARKRAE